MASTISRTLSSQVSYLAHPSRPGTPSSNASTPPPTTWDVFLSFRGIDTRNTFTDHLYSTLHGLRVKTFRDKPELRIGDVIRDDLIKAIKESKIHVVVFSENYASSSWCLDELLEIYECWRTMKTLVIAVYYNIKPSVVRYQTGSFKKAFKKHETRFKTSIFKSVWKQHRIRAEAKMQKLKKWRRILANVANFSGVTVSVERSEAGILQEIVDRILIEINPKTLNVAKYPVGLETCVQDVTALFNKHTRGFTRIGIHGMGGVGKTTLAKAVYNQNHHRFQGSCFLKNVREVSETSEGQVRLQRQLINNVLKCNNINVDNVDHGIELIRARLCSTKVLIVFDDLDDPKPLEFLEGPFAFGSTVIITTRNEDLLDSVEVEARYKVNELDDADSHQLFTKHAFGNSVLPDALKELSKEILQHAGGLPLALTTFGSKLRNIKSEKKWRWFIDRLKRVPHNDVEKSLLISFDALKLVDPIMQNMFLDIACFFIGLEEQEVVNIMETCYPFVDRNLGFLKKRSLLMINNRYKLVMHNLLSDMGRRIVCNSSPDEPQKHSRLWDPNDICYVLNEHKGSEAIEGIIPHNFYCQNTLERVSYPTEVFNTMRKLRFLYLNNVNLTGSFEHTFKEMTWFCWELCPLESLPSELHPKKLVNLALPRSKVKTVWKVSQTFKHLKSLNMSGSQDLHSTPDFTKLQYLENLIFEGCKSLKEVHVSIGSLERLVSLNLHGCLELRRLGDAICDLKALKVLNIGYCQNLEALPTKLGNIASLEEFNAEGLTVMTIPSSIGHLSKLVALRLSYNKNLETLPRSICDLRSLKVLDFTKCKNLVKVAKADMEPSKIVTLNSDTSQWSTPENIGLKDCLHLLSFAEFPPNLKRISVNGCSSMKRLPKLSNLKQLQILDLTDCSGLLEIQGLEELTSIIVLHLIGCNSSLLACTLSERLFQAYSGFERQINIYVAHFPEWIKPSGELTAGPVNNVLGNQCTESTWSVDLLPNVWHNIFGLIICFEPSKTYSVAYSLKNVATDFIWSSKSYNCYRKSLMVVVPRSIFLVKDGDHRIELRANAEIYGIHILNKMIEDSTNVNVEEAALLNS
ncbi:TMV resistance protein N-like [Apium graveolens]|uniref:TMV resistance protein N-like n=1 Tax=Apium graveolens TaxID=4045 RepID=UPI003D79A364